LKPALFVDTFRQGFDGRRQPGRGERDGAEGVAKDVTEKVALLNFKPGMSLLPSFFLLQV
jgi:hypothetical protein